jgi:hypothetical protein
MPGLSARLQRVITKTLMKVEKDSSKAFLGGMFIEPGTILRGDDANKSEPSSVIFSCIPHFDIRTPLATAAAQSDRLYPPRTLMQSYYPYEPVRERDEEQAFRRFGNARNESFIYVPCMWMLNINSNAVVTAGHGPLSSQFVKSIEIQEEDLKQLGARVEDNTLTTIRLIDSGGRALLYKLDENRSYFEMEQKLRELRVLPGNGFDAGLQLAWKTSDGLNKKIRPCDWPSILHQTNSLFIELSVIDEQKAKAMQEMLPQKDEQTQARVFPENSVPPFFHWSSAWKDDSRSPDPTPDDTKHSLRCMEAVEREMQSESLLAYETIGPVDETFTSTKYYDSLPTDTVENILTSLLKIQNQTTSRTGTQCTTLHQSIVESEHKRLEEKTLAFVSIVHETLKLFVLDLDHSTMMRKVWGAMSNLLTITGRLRGTGACTQDAKEYLDRDWKGPMTGKRSWRIRVPPPRSSDAVQLKASSYLPESDGKLVTSLKRCKRCKAETSFTDPNAALEHLRHHIKKISPGGLDALQPTPLPEPDNLKDWIRNDDQAVLEITLGGAVKVLEEATDSASSILAQLRELVDGVRKDDGYISEIYTFPRKLLEALHRLIVFYLAVERSLHFTEETFKELKEIKRDEELPYTGLGLGVLKRFCDGVKRPLMKARMDLCYMGRSPNPNDYWKRLSLGPEYVCAWLMRRLIVKPLDKSMTVTDMYREYLSTLVCCTSPNEAAVTN